VVWELIFMMLILKIPVAYLCAVVYWAVKAEPRPLEGAAVLVADGPEPQAPFRPGRRRRSPWRRGPHGGPVRTYARTQRAALAQARAGR
jgi:hypothetical protein